MSKFFITEMQKDRILRVAKSGSYLGTALSIIDTNLDGHTLRLVKNIKPGCLLVTDNAYSYHFYTVRPDMSLVELEVIHDA